MMQPHLEKAFDETNAAKQDALSFLKLEKAPLNLGVMCTIGPTRLIGLVSEFHRNNPGVNLDIHEATAKQLLERMLAGVLDVAILATPDNIEDRFDVKPLYRERFMVAFAPGHPFERLTEVPFVAMKDQPYLRRLNCEYREQLRQAALSRDAAYPIRYASEREDWIQSMVAAGLGVSFLPEFALAIPGVCVRPLADPDIAQEVALVTIASRRFSPAVAALMRQAQRHVWPK